MRRKGNHKAMKKTRTESDSIGQMEVDADAYYGVQTLRAVTNFPITGEKMSPVFIRNLALIKKACAITNLEAGVLTKEKKEAMRLAAKDRGISRREVYAALLRE